MTHLKVLAPFVFALALFSIATPKANAQSGTMYFSSFSCPISSSQTGQAGFVYTTTNVRDKVPVWVFVNNYAGPKAAFAFLPPGTGSGSFTFSSLQTPDIYNFVMYEDAGGDGTGGNAIASLYGQC